MRYLVAGRLKPRQAKALLEAIENRTLGEGSIAGSEYLLDMAQARLLGDGTIKWVEVCYCPEPLQEERPYWEEFFELSRVKDAHNRAKCRDLNGSEPWACSHCSCTERLEGKMETWGESFLQKLRTSPESVEDSDQRNCCASQSVESP